MNNEICRSSQKINRQTEYFIMLIIFKIIRPKIKYFYYYINFYTCYFAYHTLLVRSLFNPWVFIVLWLHYTLKTSSLLYFSAEKVQVSHTHNTTHHTYISIKFFLGLKITFLETGNPFGRSSSYFFRLQFLYYVDNRTLALVTYVTSFSNQS